MRRLHLRTSQSGLDRPVRAGTARKRPGSGERPAGVLGPAAYRGSYGSAPPGACGAAGRSTALSAMQRFSARRLLAAFSLAPR